MSERSCANHGEQGGHSPGAPTTLQLCDRGRPVGSQAWNHHYQSHGARTARVWSLTPGGGGGVCGGADGVVHLASEGDENRRRVRITSPVERPESPLCLPRPSIAGRQCAQQAPLAQEATTRMTVHLMGSLFPPKRVSIVLLLGEAENEAKGVDYCPAPVGASTREAKFEEYHAGKGTDTRTGSWRRTMSYQGGSRG